MNFIEAIKSEKPLRRKNKSTWVGRMPQDHWYNYGPTYYNTIQGYLNPQFLIDYIHIDVEDILANDWEVQ